MRRHLFIALAALLAVLAASLLVYQWAGLPTTLRIAVGPMTSEDTRLVVAAAQHLAREWAGTRLKLVLTEGSVGSAKALDEDRADLAVVRSDIALPQKGQTVAIARRDAAVIMAPGPSGMTLVSQLRDRRVGVLRGLPVDAQLLRTVLDHYEIPRDAVPITPLASIQEAEAAFAAGRIDALLVVGPLTGRLMDQAVAAMIRQNPAPPVFIPIGEAQAIAQRSSAFESIEMVRGVFGGTPPRPSETMTTLAVTHRVMAHSDLDDSAVAEFTRLLFAARPALSSEVPLADRIEAPDADKPSVLPIHPGATSYFEGEMLSFMDRYGDWLYLTVMGASIVGSALAALAGTAANRTRTKTMSMLNELLDIVTTSRKAATGDDLDALEREADRILVAALSKAGQGGIDETGMVAFTLGLDQARRAIAERRKWLNLHQDDGTIAEHAPRLRAAE